MPAAKRNARLELRATDNWAPADRGSYETETNWTRGVFSDMMAQPCRTMEAGGTYTLLGWARSNTLATGAGTEIENPEALEIGPLSMERMKIEILSQHPGGLIPCGCTGLKVSDRGDESGARRGLRRIERRLF